MRLPLVLCLSLLQSVASSLFVPEGPPDIPETLDTCVLKSDEWKLASEAANLAALAYTNIGVGTNFENKGLLKYQYQHSYFEVRLFQSNDKARCFVVFRGTAGIALTNIWANINTNAHSDHGVTTTEGFTNALDALEPDLVLAIQKAYSNGDCKAETTYITGHSLGGAIASVAANRDSAQWGGDRSKGGLITFGAPRPWMQPCDSVLPNLPNLNWRFVRKVPAHNLEFVDNFQDYPGFDIVPQLAPTWQPFNAHHCAVRAIALNQNSYDNTPEGLGQPTSPTDLAQNDPPDFFNAADFTLFSWRQTTTAITQVWFIHSLQGYAMVTETYANQVSKCS